MGAIKTARQLLALRKARNEIMGILKSRTTWNQWFAGGGITAVVGVLVTVGRMFYPDAMPWDSVAGDVAAVAAVLSREGIGPVVNRWIAFWRNPEKRLQWESQDGAAKVIRRAKPSKG